MLYRSPLDLPPLRYMTRGDALLLVHRMLEQLVIHNKVLKRRQLVSR